MSVEYAPGAPVLVVNERRPDVAPLHVTVLRQVRCVHCGRTAYRCRFANGAVTIVHDDLLRRPN